MASIGKDTTKESEYTKLFDFPGGDVEIVVVFKGERVIGKVVANNMVAASQVLKNYIYPPWETTTSESCLKRIDCSASNGFALLVLLRIIHLQFDGVPHELTDQVLYGVVELVEEYQCRALVQPWVDKWLSVLDPYQERLRQNFPETWLYITWALGSKERFDAVARYIAWQASVDPQTGHLIVYKGEVEHYKGPREFAKALAKGEVQRRLYSDSLSDGMEDEIKLLRIQIINDLLAIPYSQLDLFGATKQLTYCSSDSEPSIQGKRDCSRDNYNCLIKYLRLIGVFPRVTGKDITMSVNELAGEVSSLGRKMVWGMRTLFHSSYDHHRSCVLGKYDELVQLTMIRAESLSVGADNHRRHLVAKHTFAREEDPLFKSVEEPEMAQVDTEEAEEDGKSDSDGSI